MAPMNEVSEYRRARVSIPRMPLPGDVVEEIPRARVASPFLTRDGLLVANLVALAPGIIKRANPSRRPVGGNGRGCRFGPGSGRLAAEVGHPPGVERRSGASESFLRKIRRVCACLGGDENAVALVAAILVLIAGAVCLFVVGERQPEPPHLSGRLSESVENEGSASVGLHSPEKGSVIPAKTINKPAQADSGTLAGARTTGPF